MRLPMSFVAVLLFASITSSQIVDPKDHPKKASSIVPATLKASGGQLVVIDAKSAKGDVSFRWDKAVFENRATVDGKKLFLSIPEYDDDKAYHIGVISWDDKSDETVTISVQGKKLPIPKPPTPKPEDISVRLDKIESSLASIETRLIYLEKIKPNPPPDPKPEPKPDVVPIPANGLRVLIVEESAQRHTLSQGQRLIILGKEFRDFLEAKCVMGPDNRTKEYRIYDPEIAMNGESKIWQDVMKRPRASVPWIVISNGKNGFEGPLPTNLADAILLVNKYAGVNP